MNCEFEAQENVAKLGITIQKGVLVLALVSDSGVNKFIICKADHNEFLDEVTYRRSSGLPVKKKAFKAFVCNLNDNDSDDEILVYDTNKTDTKYWWSNFLELDKIVRDEDNTERAFKAIDKKVFDRIRREFPLDYTYLRNSTVRYFRSNDRFEMEEYIGNAIGDYQPYDSNLNLNVIKNRIRQLPANTRPHFDNQFNIVREKIKARFKSTVKLTDQIDLQIKEDFPENTVLAEIGIDGIKYVKIKSEIGYAYFKNSTNRNNE